MSGPPTSGTPPEVPEEFADAYKAAYEAALEAQSVPVRTGQHAERRVSTPLDRREGADDELPERTRGIRIGTHRVEDDDEPSGPGRITDSPWFVPVLLLLLGLVLVIAAYVVGRSFAHHVANNHSSAKPRVVMSEDGSSREQQVTQGPPAKGAWTGPVNQLTAVRAQASCTSKPGQDASGATVTYDAAHLTDGVVDTTWRCDGPAVGEKLTLDLGQKRQLGEVGLIPGYAKTDATDGTDRYAENNRVTKVRWSIGGKTFVQSMSGSPGDRSIRLMRVPRTTARTVTLQILAVEKGSRDTTAISEVELFAAG